MLDYKSGLWQGHFTPPNNHLSLYGKLLIEQLVHNWSDCYHGNIYFRYPLYVQAIPGSSNPMIYSAVVGPGGAGGTPQLVQWKTTSSTAHHPGMLCV